MANTYTWEFPTLQVYTQYSGETDVVYTVHWFYNGVDDTGKYKANLFGAQQIAPYTSGSPFIPFEQLTQPIVQSWVEDSMGAEEIGRMQSDLAAQIEFQKNPPVAMLTPPWLITPTPSVTVTATLTPSPTATPVTPTPTPTSGSVLPPYPTTTFPIFFTPTPTPTPAI